MRRSAARRLVSLAKQRLGPVVARRQPSRVDLPLELWDLALDDSGRLALRGVDLEAVADTWGTPLHVVDMARLDASASAALAPIAAGRGADIFYSYKTNPVPAVLSRLHARGVGAEVISEYELWLAFELGVAPERIVYNGPAKSEASLRTAVRRKIHLINANSASEVERIAAIAAEEDVPANVGIRVATPGAWGGQFGIEASSPQVALAVRSALAAPLVRLVGLHVHRGGTIRWADEWRGHLGAILSFCDGLRDATGWSPSVLDVGGSLACPTSGGIPNRQYRLNRALATDLLPPDPRDAITIAQASEMAAAVVREHFTRVGAAVPDLIQEPGRALTASSQFLLTSVIDVKHDVAPVHAVLDAGSNLADPLPHEYHQLFSVSQPAAAPVRSYRLAGPICTPADILYYNWRLPELEPGHVLAIMDAGAYFVPFSTSFSFPQPPIVAVDQDRVVEIRRRESFADIVRRDGLLLVEADER